MQSRITQLLTRLIAYLLLAIAGFLFPDISEDQKASIAAYAPAIAAALAAIGALFLDLFIHKLQNGGIFKSAAHNGLVAPVDNGGKVPRIKEFK